LYRQSEHFVFLLKLGSRASSLERRHKMLSASIAFS